MFPFATGPLAVAAGGAAAGAGVIAASAAAIVVIVILAIVIAILEGIRVADNAKLPGKIADLVVNARTTTSDPATLIGTTDGSLDALQPVRRGHSAAASQRPGL